MYILGCLYQIISSGCCVFVQSQLSIVVNLTEHRSGREVQNTNAKEKTQHFKQNGFRFFKLLNCSTVQCW